MNIGRKWFNREALDTERKVNECFVLRVLDIIEYFQPIKWFIENPYSSAMKDIPQLTVLKSYRFDYCCFGMPYKKPTRIWTNGEYQDHLCQCKRLNL